MRVGHRKRAPMRFRRARLPMFFPRGGWGRRNGSSERGPGSTPGLSDAERLRSTGIFNRAEPPVPRGLCNVRTVEHYEALPSAQRGFYLSMLKCAVRLEIYTCKRRGSPPRNRVRNHPGSARSEYDWCIRGANNWGRRSEGGGSNSAE